MREGYELAKYRLEVLNGMPFGAAENYLDENVPDEEKNFILELFHGKAKVKLCDAMMWLMQDAWENYSKNHDL